MLPRRCFVVLTTLIFWALILRPTRHNFAKLAYRTLFSRSTSSLPKSAHIGVLASGLYGGLYGGLSNGLSNGLSGGPS